MLVVSRKPGQALDIGDQIRVVVLDVRANRVKLAIEAPRNVPVLRGELVQRRLDELGRASSDSPS